MWKELSWSLLFYFTQDQPQLRSYFNCISCLFLSTTSLFYFPLTIFTLQWTLCYYVIDTILIIYLKKKYAIIDIYLYHHLMAIIAIIDGLCYGSSEFMKQSSIMWISFETSTIFLNFMLMSREPALYKGWYPSWNHQTYKISFGISFLLFRIFIGIPLIIYNITLAPGISQICLLSVIFLNFWWGWKVVRNFLLELSISDSLVFRNIIAQSNAST